MDSLNWLQQFHLVRPYWLLALLPLALVIWFYTRSQAQSRNWASVIDKRLLPHLLQSTGFNKNKTPSAGLFILGFIIIFSLAGPAFEKRPQPVFKAQSALVIILDLSRSMDATDIKPSRLSRAHFKINDILKLRKEGQSALIVYAADAYVVSPLTDDADTIASQIPALETSIMPAQGSRLDIALNKAEELFKNAGLSKGDIFIISDSVIPDALGTASQLSTDGFKTSVLAIGTEEGAPIAAQNGGFVKDTNGSIVVPRLDINSMQKLARAGGGKFSLLTASDRDINLLTSTIDIDKEQQGKEQTDAEGNKFITDVWHEEGPWLLLLVIPFAAYGFRKGLVFTFLICILPLPQPAYAFEWSKLWKNNDQQGAAELQQGNAEKAAELFNNPEWKAAAQYKAGQYQSAAEVLKDIDTAEANYNRGNALAKANNIDSAINAYNRTLTLKPDHEDAKHNKQLLEQQKKDSEKNKDKQQQDNNQDKKDGQSQQSDSQSDSGDKQDSDQQQQSKKPESEQSESPEKQQQASDSPEQNKQKPEEEKQAQQKSEDKAEKQDDQKQSQQGETTDEKPDLNQQQTQQWLKKIPDDPGGLLRRKFKYQYGRESHGDEQNPW